MLRLVTAACTVADGLRTGEKPPTAIPSLVAGVAVSIVILLINMPKLHHLSTGQLCYPQIYSASACLGSFMVCDIDKASRVFTRAYKAAIAVTVPSFLRGLPTT